MLLPCKMQTSQFRGTSQSRTNDGDEGGMECGRSLPARYIIFEDMAVWGGYVHTPPCKVRVHVQCVSHREGSPSVSSAYARVKRKSDQTSLVQPALELSLPERKLCHPGFPTQILAVAFLLKSRGHSALGIYYVR